MPGFKLVSSFSNRTESVEILPSDSLEHSARLLRL